MANAPQVANDKQRDVIAPQGTPTPTSSESKTNWLKDLLIPIVLLLVGAFLGIAGEEYKLRSNTPKLRRAEVARREAGSSGLYRQKISSTFYPVGRSVIPTLMISAVAVNPRVRIIDERFNFEPPDQEPQSRQVENEGNPESMRTLEIVNFHEPQRVTWTVEAETPSAPTGSLIRFNYLGVNDVQDDNHLPWTEKLPLLRIVLGLIIYSVVATLLVIYFRFRRS